MIEVAYTPSEGIVVRGTERAHAPAFKKTRDRLKWYGAGGFWYVPRTRDTVQPKWRVDRLAEELRAALPGVEVEVTHELGDGVRPAEEREVDRKERAEERADRLEDRADRIAGEAVAREKTAHDRADQIPFGQPILVGHHSEKRDRNFREKIRAGFDKAHELRGEAAEARGAAHTARKTVERAEKPGAVLRRIDRLEAGRRKIERELEGETELVSFRLLDGEETFDPNSIEFSLKYACPDGGTCADPACVAENARRAGIVANATTEASRLRSIPVTRFPGAQRKRELEARLAELKDEVGHLRSKLPADLPGPAKFKKGDLVTNRFGKHCRVERVNPKSLSVVPLEPQWSGQKYTIPYDEGPRLVGENPTSEQKEQSS